MKSPCSPNAVDVVPTDNLQDFGPSKQPQHSTHIAHRLLPTDHDFHTLVIGTKQHPFEIQQTTPQPTGHQKESQPAMHVMSSPSHLLPSQLPSPLHPPSSARSNLLFRCSARPSHHTNRRRASADRSQRAARPRGPMEGCTEQHRTCISRATGHHARRCTARRQQEPQDSNGSGVV